jgi:hypothetical protein
MITALIIGGIVLANGALAVCAIVVGVRDEAEHEALLEFLRQDACKRGAPTPRERIRLVTSR